MGCPACTEPQCLYKGTLYLYLLTSYLNQRELLCWVCANLFARQRYGYRKNIAQYCPQIIQYIAQFNVPILLNWPTQHYYS